MKVFKTRKARACHCCGSKLPKGAWISNIDGNHYKLYCGKIYRLHVGSIKWIKDNFLNG